MDISEIFIGSQYTYKTAPGRGRPFVGVVADMEEDKVVMKNRHYEFVEVSPDMIIQPYKFKPYMTKARRHA